MNQKRRYQNRASKGAEKVLRKMCKIVGCNYDTFNFDQDDWFQKYSWSVKQEKEFSKWLKKKLKNDKSVRNAMTEFPYLAKYNKAYRERCVNAFLWSRGWKIKSEEDE